MNGYDLAADPEAAKASLGFIPDRPYIYEKLTAGEFLQFHAGLYGMNGHGLDQRVQEMLDLFELGRWETRAGRELLARNETAARHVRGVPASPEGGARG